MLILLTVRHPASWLVSLFRNPYQSIRPIPDTLAQFLDFNWKTHRRERLGCRSFKPLDLYRAKMASYFSFADRLSALRIPHSFVRFEDIVLEQESVFSAIAGNLLEPRAKFEPLQVSTKDDGLFQKAAQAGGRTTDEPSKDLTYYRQYYGEERWRGSIAGLESEINARVDWVGLAGFGYEPL